MVINVDHVTSLQHLSVVGKWLYYKLFHEGWIHNSLNLLYCYLFVFFYYVTTFSYDAKLTKQINNRMRMTTGVNLCTPRCVAMIQRNNLNNCGAISLKYKDVINKEGKQSYICNPWTTKVVGISRVDPWIYNLVMRYLTLSDIVFLTRLALPI